MIVAIIQARMGSTRLPGKVSMPIHGKSVLARVIERTRQIPEVDRVVVATTSRLEDEWVRAEASKCEVLSYLGPERDVLRRYELVASCLSIAPDDLIVRLTADCPLLDPSVSSRVIHLHQDHKVDYASNLRDWPDGLDTEVFTRQALQEAVRMASGDEDREHVTPWMRRNLLCLELPHEPNLRHIKFSVDTREDLQRIRDLYQAYRPDCAWEQMLPYLVSSESTR